MTMLQGSGHPCFDQYAHFRVGRMHLPVAPKCNVRCAYCRRAVGSSENRPGVCDKIISPAAALAQARDVLARDETIKVVGIAGPGDALANDATFETLSLVHGEFPELQKCVSTNGLLLAERIDELVAVGVGSVSVTVNAVDEAIGSRFYDAVYLGGEVHREDAFQVLSFRQLEGIEMAARRGIAVKINSVLVPELNLDHLPELARTVAGLGATLMNIMPLKPIAGMRGMAPPSCEELELVRSRCQSFLPQFRLCQQCRADAIGIPGSGLAGTSHGSIPLFH